MLGTDETLPPLHSDCQESRSVVSQVSNSFSSPTPGVRWELATSFHLIHSVGKKQSLSETWHWGYHWLLDKYLIFLK